MKLIKFLFTLVIIAAVVLGIFMIPNDFALSALITQDNSKMYSALCKTAYKKVSNISTEQEFYYNMNISFKDDQNDENNFTAVLTRTRTMFSSSTYNRFLYVVTKGNNTTSYFFDNVKYYVMKQGESKFTEDTSITDYNSAWVNSGASVVYQDVFYSMLEKTPDSFKSAYSNAKSSFAFSFKPFYFGQSISLKNTTDNISAVYTLDYNSRFRKIDYSKKLGSETSKEYQTYTITFENVGEEINLANTITKEDSSSATQTSSEPNVSSPSARIYA
jgi:hypothetical protein